LQNLKMKEDPDLLLGIDASDDAGIYRLTDELALIQTLDFFTPIVNDPYDFGRIAAANALSDVYAMGGRPLTAMNIVCFPIKDMDKSVLRSILEGGLEMIHKADAVMVGGHSVEDPELKYGLSVTGIVHPQKFLTNAGARPGDLLVLTKPLGTGILATALKAGELDKKTTEYITRLMATLNKDAAEATAEVGVNACTDITGFGLLGHCLEMAMASNIGIKIDTKKVPIISEAKTFASIGFVPGGSYTNQKYCRKQLEIAPSVDPILLDIMSDPQTSGGLLISVPEDKAPKLIQELKARKTPAANVIGSVVEKMPEIIQCC
jgi:selenide,water dikinase